MFVGSKNRYDDGHAAAPQLRAAHVDVGFVVEACAAVLFDACFAHEKLSASACCASGSDKPVARQNSVKAISKYSNSLPRCAYSVFPAYAHIL
jgi:hypothetical protein